MSAGVVPGTRTRRSWPRLGMVASEGVRSGLYHRGEGRRRAARSGWLAASGNARERPSRYKSPVAGGPTGGLLSEGASRSGDQVHRWRPITLKPIGPASGARSPSARGPTSSRATITRYYRYKRAKFLERFLDTLDVDGKTVLEVGCGPGGNLKHLLEHRHAAKLRGVDLAQPMVDLARTHLPPSVEITKVDGSSLPFADQSLDLTYTVTVLQHNTSEPMLRGLANEICRVTKSTVVLMEDVGDRRGTEQPRRLSGAGSETL